jgi:hypothetical protein
VRELAEDDRRRMNQIRAASSLHIFDVFETCLADAARAHAMHDVDSRDTLVPLLRLDAFDHNELVTQQHYIACVRGDEGLEPSFVKVLKVPRVFRGESAGARFEGVVRR